jgi:hypothetical protein
VTHHGLLPSTLAHAKIAEHQPLPDLFTRPIYAGEEIQMTNSVPRVTRQVRIDVRFSRGAFAAGPHDGGGKAYSKEV